MHSTNINEFGVTEHITVGNFLFNWKHIQYVIPLQPIPFANVKWNLP
jgi:hypothetical protein